VPAVPGDGDERPVRPLLALGLVSPAVLALVISYVWPTIWTINASFQARRLLHETPQRVGLANYRRLIEEGWWSGAGHILTYAVVPALVLVTIAPALAWLVHRTASPGRRIASVAFAIPIAFLAPVALAAAWRIAAVRGAAGGDPSGTIDPAGETRTGYWLMAAVVAGVAGATVYLMALNRTDPDRERWRTLGILAAVAVGAATALAWQELAYPWLGAPPDAARAPAAMVIQTTLTGFDLGLGSAAAVMLLVPLLVLGVAVALLMVRTGLSVEVRPADGEPERDTTPRMWWSAVIGADLLLIALLALLLSVLWPVLGARGARPVLGPNLGELLVNTWLPPLASTVVGVGLAALAGFGIGALRPLGRWSEMLLLPFAPWLFVGTTPLLVSAFADSLASNEFGTVSGLIPPAWLNVPALFLFTLVAHGLSTRRDALLAQGLPQRTATIRTHVTLGLPTVLVTAFAVWLWHVQDLAWPLVAAGALTPTATTEVAAALAGPIEDAWLLPVLIPVIPALAAFIAAQVCLLDRFTLRTRRTGDGSSPDGPSSPDDQSIVEDQSSAGDRSSADPRRPTESRGKHTPA
jgi:ABC-type sugar transport system permease subunit